MRRVPISRMAPQPGQEVAVERVVEVDRERKEELILAKQVRQGTVVIQGGANILRVGSVYFI